MERLVPRIVRLSLPSVVAAGLLLTSGVGAAQERAEAAEACGVSGHVRTTSGAPVEGAIVATVPASESATTGPDGAYCFDPPRTAEPLRLLVVAEGFGMARRALESSAPQAPLVADFALRPEFGEEVVVTASGTKQRLMDVPIHLSVLDSAVIEASGARTLAEAVEWGSGIRVESNCQNCNTSQVRMLGLEGPYTQVLIEGQPTISSLALVYGLEQLPARMIESVEVVKGGGSALYGAGAVAGVINLLPHRASHTHFDVEAQAVRMGGETGGSAGFTSDWTPREKSGGLTLIGHADEVRAADLDGDGFSDISKRQLEALSARYEYFVRGDSGRLTAELVHTAEDRRGGDALDRPPHEALIAEEILSQRGAASLAWLHQVSGKLDYRALVSFARTERDSYYGTGRDPNAYGTTENPLWILDSQVNGYVARGTWTGGVQSRVDETEDVQLGYGRSISQRFTQVSSYVQHERSVAKGVTLLAGARLDRHGALDDEIFSPRLAAMWSPRSDMTVRATYSRGFRPPAIFDEDLHIRLVGDGEAQVLRNAEGLREERSASRLLSWQWRPRFGRRLNASFEVNAFSTTLDDLFLQVERDDVTTPAVEFERINFGRAEVEGVELNLGLRLGSQLAVDLSGGWQEGLFAEEEPQFGSREFYRTPNEFASVSAVWTGDVWTLFAGARFTGSMLAPHFAGFIPEDRLEQTPSFLTFDVGVARDVQLPGSRSLRLSLELKNLTDAYQDDLDRGPLRDGTYVYGPRFPRSVSVGVAWHWR